MSQGTRVISAVFCCVVLSILCHTLSAYAPVKYACCVKYTQKPLDFNLIKGFVEQSSREVCRIDAIIFHTRRMKKVCANPDDAWVKAIISRFSAKMKTSGRAAASTMSNTTTPANSSSPQ